MVQPIIIPEQSLTEHEQAKLSSLTTCSYYNQIIQIVNFLQLIFLIKTDTFSPSSCYQQSPKTLALPIFTQRRTCTLLQPK